MEANKSLLAPSVEVRLSVDNSHDAAASHRATGLSSAEAQARLRLNGPNEIPEPRRHPVLAFLHKFWGLSA